MNSIREYFVVYLYIYIFLIYWYYKPVSRYWFTVDIISVSMEISWSNRGVARLKMKCTQKKPMGSGSRLKALIGGEAAISSWILANLSFIYLFFLNKCMLHPFPVGTAKYSWCFFCDISLCMQYFSSIKLYGIYQMVSLIFSFHLF